MKMQKMSEAEIKELRKRAKRDKTGLLSHLIWCYETVFDNACDPNAETLEFKPEILAAMEAYKENK